MKIKVVGILVLSLLSLFFSGCGSAEKKVEPVELKTSVKIKADADNEKLILGALWIMQNRTPDFFKLVDQNVKEIRQSTGQFTTGPVKTIEGTGRIEFQKFSGHYNEYNIADFLVHEATHIVDQKKGLPLTRVAEIRARETEIAFLKELAKAENRSFDQIINFVKKEIDQIKAGKLYSDLD
ncbi:MAG: hypothetical protein ACOYXC_16270 [Candidatus Rifleibacteriota bacterium]